MPRDGEDAAAVSALAADSGDKKKKEKASAEKKLTSKTSPLMLGEGAIATSKKRNIIRRNGGNSGSSTSSSSSSGDCCVDADAPHGDDGADSSDQNREVGAAYGERKATGRRKSARHGQSKPKAVRRSSVAPVVPMISPATLAAGRGGVLADEIHIQDSHSELPSSQQRKAGDFGKGNRDDGQWPPPSELDLTPAVVAAAKHHGSREDNRSSTSSTSRTSSTSSTSDNLRASPASSPSRVSSCAATPAKEKRQSQPTSSRSSISTQRRYPTRGATSSVVHKSLTLSASKGTSSVDGRPKRRNKRGRPSERLPASDGGGGGGDAPAQSKSSVITVPAGATAKETRTTSCSNEGSCSARDDVRGVPTVATSHDGDVTVSDRTRGLPVDAEQFPLSGNCSKETEAGVLGGVLRGPKETAAREYGEHLMQAPDASTNQRPEPEVQVKSNNINERPKRNNVDENPEEEQASTRPAEPTAYERPQGIVAVKNAQRSGSIRRNSRVRQQAAQERTAGSADTRGGSSQKHRRSPDERRKRNQAAGAADQSPALGVKVINRGTTKHLVLTTVDDVIGGNPGGTGDRPRDTAALLTPPRRDGSSSSCQAVDARHHEHHQPRRALDSSEMERIPVHQDDELRTAAASIRKDATAPLRGADQEEAASSRRVDVAVVGTCIPRTLPPKRPSVGVTAAKQCPQQWEHHPFDAESLETGALQPAVATTTLPQFASDMAPVFSVGERAPLRVSPSRPEAAPLSADSLVQHPWGVASSPASPTSSDASSFPGLKLTVERTAKYVRQQASFHADVSEDFINDETSSVEESASPMSPRRPAQDAASCSTAAAVSDTAPDYSTVKNARRPRGWVRVEEHRECVKPAPSLSPSQPPAAAASWENGAREGRRRTDRTGVKTRRLLTFPNAAGSYPDSPRRQPRRELSDAPLGLQHPPTVSVDGETLARNENHRGHYLLENECSASPAFPKRPDSGAGQSELLPRSIEVCSSAGGGGSGGDILHFRADFSRHLHSGGQPALFFLRPNESLAVTRIEGEGRLLVTLREEAGAAGVVAVDGAVVHDSAAHFGHAAIQTDHRFPYVTGHRYEFQAVPAQGVQLAMHGGDAQRTADSGGAEKSATSVGLDVVFSVMSAHSEEAKLCKTDALRFSLPTFQAPTCLPTKKTTPAKRAGDTSTATSAAWDITPTLGRPSQDHRRSDCQSPPPVSVTAPLAGPSIKHPPSSTEPADSAIQLSSMTSTPVGPETSVASRSLDRSVPDRTTARVESGKAEGTSRRGPPRKASPPDDKHGDYSTRIPAAGQSQFGVVGVDIEHRNKQELNTTTRGRGSRHRSPVTTESGRNTAGAEGHVAVMETTLGCERHAKVNVNANAVDRCVPQSSTQTAGSPVDYPRRDIAVPEMTGGHSAARLGWNPAWERQPPSPTRVPSQTSLPYIRQQAEPRSAFGSHDSGDNRTPLRVVARDSLGSRSPAYDQEPTRGKRHTTGIDRGKATRYRRSRPTHEAHHDTTAAAAGMAYHDHSHREKGQYPTLPPHRRHIDDDERRPMLSPPPQDGRSGREDGRRGVTPERRWDYRLRQHSADESHNLAPDQSPNDMRGPGRRYDRRASEGEDQRMGRRGWREDEISSLTMTGNTHELRRNALRDSVVIDGSQRTRRRSPENDPRVYEYQAHDDHRATASLSESSLRGDVRLPPGASRWQREAQRDPWRVARSTKGRGEHTMGFTEAVFEGGERGYPRAQRGAEEARYDREPMGRRRAPSYHHQQQHAVHHTCTEIPAYRKLRHDAGSNMAQVGVHVGSSDRTHPRWNKF